MAMIKKVLVANRGEIARRVFRTCRDMGIATVAVYSEPDADAPFVREADEAVPLGGAVPAESYLRADRVLDAARLAGADAIHPGYGFLSENAEFARRCGEAGIVFIGPGAEAIESMGSKLTARTMMQSAGVPVLPGWDLTGADLTGTEVSAAADEIGWPVLVKASFGGGGRGMRVVRDPAALAEAIDSARREAGSAFGDDTVFLEHYVDEPRHVEIQIFGDQHGNIVHLGERECSIQRRHQKIIEESPSPAVDDSLREKMGAAAVAAGEALGYVGAGTVEFLLAPTGDFYFLEVNTRLQVEHPVTELVTGLDLVRLQIDIASGRPLGPEVRDPRLRGHAIEARLYAEDVTHDFLPDAGTLDLFEVPAGAGVRVDSGVESGDVVSTNYDPMLAKVIAFGRDREEAAARLASTLRRTRAHGVTTNRSLLVGILEDDEFGSGRIDTHYLQRRDVAELASAGDAAMEPVAAIVAALADQAANRSSAPVAASIPSGFRNNASQPQTRVFTLGDRELVVGYRLGRDPLFEVDGQPIDVQPISVHSDRVELLAGGIRRGFTVSASARATYVSWPHGSLALVPRPRFPDSGDQAGAGALTAPMPGTVTRLPVAVGDEVTAGQTVIVIEAMKMEHAITAPADGTVASLPSPVGTTVDSGAVLVVLDSEEDG